MLILRTVGTAQVQVRAGSQGTGFGVIQTHMELQLHLLLNADLV